jgi:hypothetical protein
LREREKREREAGRERTREGERKRESERGREGESERRERWPMGREVAKGKRGRATACRLCVCVVRESARTRVRACVKRER